MSDYHYKDDLPQDMTQNEARETILTNRTLNLLSPLIAASCVVAFTAGSIFSGGFSLPGLLLILLYFAGAAILYGICAFIVFILRHLEVHPVVLAVIAVAAPILLSLLVNFASSGE